MRRRLKKKLYRKFLYDLIYELSSSDLWRKKINRTSHENRICINRSNCENIPAYLREKIVSYNLSYDVYKVEKNQEYIAFRFESTSFSDQVYDFSFNNPDKVL